MGLLPEREIIGPPDCPIMYRWTLRPWSDRESASARWKLMVHHFLPNADDRDVHDHPRPFWTFVLRGFYDDMKPCSCLERRRYLSFDYVPLCLVCGNRHVVLNERMRAGMLRRRPARHRHRTKVGPKGCWTIVLMGPLQRRWGFWRWGVWWDSRDYEAEFGFAMRCEDLDKEYRK